MFLVSFVALHAVLVSSEHSQAHFPGLVYCSALLCVLNVWRCYICIRMQDWCEICSIEILLYDIFILVRFTMYVLPLLAQLSSITEQTQWLLWVTVWVMWDLNPKTSASIQLHWIEAHSGSYHIPLCPHQRSPNIYFCEGYNYFYSSHMQLSIKVALYRRNSSSSMEQDCSSSQSTQYHSLLQSLKTICFL